MLCTSKIFKHLKGWSNTTPPQRNLLGPPLWSGRFNPRLLYFQYFLSKNANLTLIWCIFAWYYSIIDLINESSAIIQDKYFLYYDPHGHRTFNPPYHLPRLLATQSARGSMKSISLPKSIFCTPFQSFALTPSTF